MQEHKPQAGSGYSGIQGSHWAFFLERVVSEVGDILRLLMNQKRIRFGTEIDPKLDEVIIDPAKFKQVLYNYLSNAFKFTPEGGQVLAWL